MVSIDGYAFHFVWIIVAFLAGLFFLNVLAYWHSKRPRKFGNEGSSISRLPAYGFSQSVNQENKKIYFSVVHSDGGAEYEVSIDGLSKLLKIFDDFTAFGQNYSGPLKSGTFTSGTDPLKQISLSYALKQEGSFMPWILKLHADKRDGMVTISMNDEWGGPIVPLDHFAIWVSKLKDFLTKNGCISEPNTATRE